MNKFLGCRSNFTFERHGDRWSPVYVRRVNWLKVLNCVVYSLAVIVISWKLGGWL